MGVDLQTHKYEKDTNTGETRLKEVRHYTSIRKDGEPEYFLQAGKVYAGGGEEVETVPDWVQAHIDRMSVEAKRAFGFVNRGGRPPKDKEVN